MRRYRKRLILLLLMILILIVPEENSTGLSPGPSLKDLVIEMNQLTYTIAEQHDHFYSFTGIRTLTMVHLAIHDALNSIEPKYTGYAYNIKNPDADPLAAVTQILRLLLINAFPERSDTIEAVCDGWVSKRNTSEDRFLEGIELGNTLAEHYMTIRSHDGHQKQGDYTPMTKPGDYQYTPGWNGWVLKPDFNYALPFALDTVTMFRSPPPPMLTSDEYADAYREVMEYGRKGSTRRSTDQTNYAHWWAEFAEHSWNRIGRISAGNADIGYLETARMFALINMDIYDIYLASLESKYYYDTWRPFTAIRNGDTDGNDKTSPDPGWEPEMITPPWPEYPSAHAAVAGGGAEIIAHIYGTTSVAFTMESTSALPHAKTRTFTDLDMAAKECADSRVMNGFHFRFATEEGLAQGREIARYIIRNYLKPIK